MTEATRLIVLAPGKKRAENITLKSTKISRDCVTQYLFQSPFSKTSHTAKLKRTSPRFLVARVSEGVT